MSLLIFKRALLLIIRALLTEKMLVRLMVYAGDYLVKRSGNKLDDKVWPAAREALISSVDGI